MANTKGTPHTKVSLDEWLKPNSERLLRLKRWIRDGLNDEQIYNNMGISKATFYRWQKDEAFKTLFVYERETVISMVEDALIKRAMGYDYKEDGLTKDGMIVPISKHMPADVKALIFYLTNRKDSKWKTKVETQSNVEMQMEAEFANADNFIVRQKEQVEDSNADDAEPRTE